MNKENNLFNEVTLSRKILLPPNKLDVNYDQYVLDRIRELFEEKCAKEGYIDKNSIQIKDRSLGLVEKGPSTGTLEFKIIFTARVCNPPPGKIIRCKVYDNNKMGVLARIHPLKVVVLRVISPDKEVFEHIKVGDEIMVEVIERTFDLNDKEIKVIGKILSGNEVVNVKFKKIKGKSLKDEDSFVAGEDDFVESNITGDDEDENDILDAEDEDDEEEGPDVEEAEDEDGEEEHQAEDSEVENDEDDDDKVDDDYDENLDIDDDND